MNDTAKRAWMPRLRVFAAVAGLIAFALTAGFSSRVSATSVSGPISLSSVHWIFYKKDFNHLRAESPGLIKQILAGPGTYVLEHRAGVCSLVDVGPLDDMGAGRASGDDRLMRHRLRRGVRRCVKISGDAVFPHGFLPWLSA